MKRLAVFLAIVLFIVPLLALDDSNAARKYPFYYNFGSNTNVKITYDGNITNHSWLRTGGSDTVTVWYFRGGDSTSVKIPPLTGMPTTLVMDNVDIIGGSAGGIRVIKASGTSLQLIGARDWK